MTGVYIASMVTVAFVFAACLKVILVRDERERKEREESLKYFQLTVDRLLERIQRPEVVVPLAEYPESSSSVPFDDDEKELEALNDRVF